MKSSLILLVTLYSFIGTKTEQNPIVIKATYEYSEDGIFYFTDYKGKKYEFRGIEDEPAIKYDLLEDNYKGEAFVITYKTETDVDESDEEFEIYIITDLKLVED
ncbi:hypothetical protein ACWGOQ_0014960 [Aquimarina sp. M1]